VADRNLTNSGPKASPRATGHVMGSAWLEGARTRWETAGRRKKSRLKF